MRNKILLIALAASFLLPAVSLADKLNVIATTPDLGAIAKAVGSDLISVESLARPGEDPHFVDAKPSFVVKLNRADVLIEGGAQLEAGWLPPLLEGSRNSKIAAGAPGRIIASEGLTLLDVPTALDRSLGDVHPSGNPHYLLNPQNGRFVASTLTEAFCRLDQEHCPGFRENFKKFDGELAAKIAAWQRALAPLKGTDIVTYHRNFDYFANAFGLRLVDTLEPKPGIPPSPAHIQELVQKMKAQKVRFIIVEPNREQQNPEFVAKQTGAKLLLLPIMPGERGTSDYISLFDYLVAQLTGK